MEFWTLSLSGIPVVGATPEAAQKLAREIERPYDQYDNEEAEGNYLRDEVEDMRHPTW